MYDSCLCVCGGIVLDGKELFFGGRARSHAHTALLTIQVFDLEIEKSKTAV